jgi:hypothetical protein
VNEAMDFLKLLLPLRGKQIDQREVMMETMVKINQVSRVIFDYFQATKYKKAIEEGK